MITAYLRNASGTCLVIPVDNNAPRLFLEWVRDQRKAVSFSIDTKYKQVEPGGNLYDEWFDQCAEVMVIRITNGTREMYDDCKYYINGNL